MKELFTADNHFFHQRIQIFCPGRQSLGQNLEAIDKEMIRLWNEKVDQKDKVTVCGDFASTKDVERIKALLKKLNGEKHLIIGNHDSVRWSDYLRAGFTTVQRYKFINTCYGPVGLAHDPSACITDTSIPWLVGHLHQQFVRFGNAINVGVDVRGYAPITLEELSEDFRITKSYHMKEDIHAKVEILGIE